jgi:hypothetical protein
MDKQKLFAACAPKGEDFTLPDGQKIRLRSLTLGEREALFLKAKEKKDISNTDMAALWVIAGCDEFDDSDFDAVTKFDGSVLQSMSTAIVRIAGMAEDSIEEAEKN